MSRAEYIPDVVIKDGVWVDARAYGEDLDDVTIQAALDDIGSDDKVLVLSPGAWSLADDITVPTNVAIKVMHGALLTVSAAKTLTINGPILDSPSFQWLSIPAATGIAGTPLCEHISANWFGSDADAITFASSWANDAGLPLDISGAWTGLDETVIIVSATTPNTLNASLTFASGLGTDTAVQVGTSADGSVSVPIRNKNIYLPQVLSWKSGTGWTGFGTGVEVRNLYECNVWLAQVYGWAVGLRVNAYGTGSIGCGYNQFFITYLNTNKVQVYVKPGGVSNWTNENIFYGGRYYFNSTEGVGVADTRDILIERVDGGTTPNSNVFIKPSLEGTVAEYQIEILAGSYNVVIHPRCEGGPRIAFTSLDAAQYSAYNTVNLLYSSNPTTNKVYQDANSSANIVTSHRWGSAIETASVAGGMFKLNPRTKTNPVFRLYDLNADIFDDATSIESEWYVEQSPAVTKFKKYDDDYARIYLDHETGRIYVGDGTVDPTGKAYLHGRNNNLTAVGPSDLGKELLALNQNDEDQAFVNFSGTAAADDSKNISSGVPTGSTVRYIKVEIGGNAYWMKAETWA